MAQLDDAPPRGELANVFGAHRDEFFKQIVGRRRLGRSGSCRDKKKQEPQPAAYDTHGDQHDNRVLSKGLEHFLSINIATRGVQSALVADLQPARMAPMLAMMSGLGSLSGGIGGWDGWRSGRCRVWPLACAAVFLVLILAINWAQLPPPGSIPWSPYLVLTVCVWTPPDWLACWAGQCVGIRGRTKYAEPHAGSDGV